MSELNPLFFVAPSLEMYFVNKLDGTPLSGGYLIAYVSGSTTVFKPVYKYDGTTYTAIPIDGSGKIFFNSDGTFSDNMGNNILPYWFPYDGTPDNTTETLQLYDIYVYSSDNIFQFSRLNWPNITSAELPPTDITVRNYIPNGQFLLHNDNNADIVVPNFDYGMGVQTAVRDIAPGGWTYEVSSDSTSFDTDEVTFQSFNGYTNNPSASPQYSCKIVRNGTPSDDKIIDLRVKFPDVNKFGTDADQVYSFVFNAKSTTSNNVPVRIFTIKYFGVGGSPTLEAEATDSPASIETEFKQFVMPFTIPTNAADVIGPGSFIQFAIRMQASQTFSLEFTDMMLLPGEAAVSQDFPTTPDADFIAPSLAGWLPTPAYDGSDLYLPVKLGPEGLIFDSSEIGNIVQKIDVTQFTGSVSTLTNEIICDGSQYLTTGYSDLGIPYARLQSILFSTHPNLLAPIYGTGPDFVQASWYDLTGDPATDLLFIATGSPGAVTDSTAGTTTFNIAKIAEGADTYPFKGFVSSTQAILIIGNGPSNAPTIAISAGTSGFTVENVRNSESSVLIAQVICTDASIIAPGSYFYFYVGGAEYYVWYKVDGVGNDPIGAGPPPAGTGIEVNVKSVDTSNFVSSLTAKALFGSQVTSIQCLPASSISAGQYWQFYDSTDSLWKVWYSIDGVGTAPSGNVVQVKLLSADDAHTVTSKTIAAINSMYFAVPDFVGRFLRGYDPTGIRDSETYSRYTELTYAFGNGINTYQTDESYQHQHTITGSSAPTNVTVYTPGGAGNTHIAGTVSAAGANTVMGSADTSGNTDYYPNIFDPNNTYGLETRPINAYVLYAIKY